MKCLQKTVILSFLLFILKDTTLPLASEEHHPGKNKANTRSLRSIQRSNNNTRNERELTLNIVNLTYRQPFSKFFVLVHNSQATPLYILGQKASNGLARLAEYGQPGTLENYYKNKNRRGVKTVSRYNPMTREGSTSQIKVRVTEHPLVSIAAMCENTNDCFVALNGVRPFVGMTLDVPGLDAGSEENNESCNSVPGPACAGRGARLQRSGNDEGYVHVHRGILGVGDMVRDMDWRNPMMRVTVSA